MLAKQIKNKNKQVNYSFTSFYIIVYQLYGMFRAQLLILITVKLVSK